MAIEFDIQESKKLKGVYIITPNKFRDLRGEIWSAFTSEAIDKLLPNNLRFIHDKFIHSKHNVIRGIHGDKNTYKLATCVYGQIHQVVVDCNENSPTYLQYEEFVIDANNQKMILVPAGFGNAHYVSSQSAVYYYKCAYIGKYIDADKQFTYAWNDHRIGIEWPTTNPILSERDMLITQN
ncbi:dTDP-4-dehydrorhamnose 3,5-epimerase family protein [Campylobacter hyointestinalis]|uniref:dTDP-4-dehydrorhamnose 3,5-epimerase n=1 Tax=Campylobacter hyointestinalis subsp. lawsonii TaxID=91353 RepID=A0AAV6EDA1_CAMHY|nr:dTDP-4-dehydrorhamnose 3,5-epimerase family protein [Campylobacter hyointestinalis]KAB0612174.1 dTDP-4-dehydrorhamnose 3,5-epimerase [Campylobacter hyointestinalis subsp. lawsonii]QKF69438.1 dTDP-4-dehydrorhamnose 3,5-epimerase [Campylobacter hyointestinalis subsp. lawsonii]RAZ27310.1 dTDP-4-dehydrorhamnose 3,5-epimerase [Campylobacter hyointestinalis subsp. lawsonii]